MFEIFRDRNRKYRFRLLGEKNNVIAVSEGYDEKARVVAAINDAREYAATSRIADKSALSEELVGSTS
ncbi:YegP family protein [Arthrobacter sp. GCM10027362]|uniref:YegP family protein n=1 Tax=Arthrobacter sp. GCM10027362 TaxID=3273379 RepID=UPI0036429E1E